MTPCYVGTLSYSSACIYEKKPRPGGPGFTYGAASQIRTGDLILTKDALYRLSYSSRYAVKKYGAASQIRTGDLILTKDALYRLSYSSIFDSF